MFTFAALIVAGLLYSLNDTEKSTKAYSFEQIINKGWLHQNAYPITATDDSRAPDQTFLTYPEWFLVHSPAEQAKYFKWHTATTFPYMTHIDQIWDSYAIVSHTIDKSFPYNSDYHLMIKVIGTSASIEYALKAWYESIIGRITNTDDMDGLTQEDRFTQVYTQEYVDFIRTTPWYDFDFRSQLVKLWCNTNFFGPNFLRKIERKYLLTSELLIKTAYAKLIKLGTQTIYDEASLTTVVLVNSFPDDLNVSSIKILKRLDNGNVLLQVPRYAAFNKAAVNLAKHNISFLEVAGNNGAILLTLRVDTKRKFTIKNTQLLFEQPLPSTPDQKRIAMVTTVPNLSSTLRSIVNESLKIEHIYDY